MIAKVARYSYPIAKIRASMSDLLDAREYAMLVYAQGLDAMVAALNTTAYATATERLTMDTCALAQIQPSSDQTSAAGSA